MVLTDALVDSFETLLHHGLYSRDDMCFSHFEKKVKIGDFAVIF